MERRRLAPEAAARSLRRVLVFFRPDPEEAREYVRAVHEAFEWMDPERFEAVCRLLAAMMEPFKRPVPSEFHAAYMRLKAELGWDPRPAVGCAKCDGQGVRYHKVADGAEVCAFCECHPMNRGAARTARADAGSRSVSDLVRDIVAGTRP
jgi:hypothetical protein